MSGNETLSDLPEESQPNSFMEYLIDMQVLHEGIDGTVMWKHNCVSGKTSVRI